MKAKIFVMLLLICFTGSSVSGNWNTSYEVPKYRCISVDQNATDNHRIFMIKTRFSCEKSKMIETQKIREVNKAKALYKLSNS